MTFVYIVLFENTLMHYKITVMMHESVLLLENTLMLNKCTFYDA